MSEKNENKGNPTRKIIVNGREKTVEGKTLSFEQVIDLAWEEPHVGDNWEFTVTYWNGPGQNKEGSLRPGQEVHIKNGMVFNATATDKS